MIRRILAVAVVTAVSAGAAPAVSNATPSWRSASTAFHVQAKHCRKPTRTNRWSHCHRATRNTPSWR